ncbi:nitrile hydratase subunit alpha [Arthrobacter sp. SLBN-112]|uniref:nitrile hydratase subunit alpha n=1 Tax=Arthrobacter sp. SLBN-112 TaxID=2768452 RepID=UPI0027B801EE|nr:nitrile hydratase subunit alpha [Arthrobacter sp. SLBN-112]MDQ0799486.1 nitrile hydratase [Arthrobacter sp. SLBN-112]
MTDFIHAFSGPVVPAATAEFDEYMTARVKAMEAILIERGVVSEEAVERISNIYEHQVGPQIGAKVVARAWTEPDFKARLLEDATAACAEMGVSGLQGEDMLAVENTDEVHNVIVCTLCSCYPWPVLGLPPNWYKKEAYRSRVVRDPRSVLKEFGLDLAPEKEIRVWDSSSELRYWVLPQRPTGTEGLSAEELAELVTRDSMLGVGVVAPAKVGA